MFSVVAGIAVPDGGGGATTALVVKGPEGGSSPGIASALRASLSLLSPPVSDMVRQECHDLVHWKHVKPPTGVRHGLKPRHPPREVRRQEFLVDADFIKGIDRKSTRLNSSH